MCTFIANDLDDIEKDKVNHPERALPTGRLTTAVAVMIYFLCVGFALFFTRFWVEPIVAFWYYGLFILAISYGYLVDGFPSLKAPYVALAVTIPILMLATQYPGEPRLYLVSASVFLLTLGREICGNIRDREGDAFSIMHRINPRILGIAAFSLQVIGLVFLIFQLRTPADIVFLVLMILLEILSTIYWFAYGRFKESTGFMKLQYFIGLYFFVYV